MKHVFTLAFFLGLTSALLAQLPNGATAPNFKGKDLNGRTWELYDILESGRPVVMDISATWCGPCWSYHNSNALKTLYNTQGPAGTGQVMVFFVEGDNATNTACLYGPTGCVGGTQGNWVANTPYPIIDDAAISNAYDVGYFPTVYLICPDKKVKEVGQINATALWNQAAPCVGNIPQHYATIADFQPGTVSTQLCGAQAGAPSVKLMNLGAVPITEAVVELKWKGATLQSKTFTGNTQPFGLMDVGFDPIVVNEIGTLSVEVVSVNGGNSNAQLATASIDFTAAPQKYSSDKILIRVRTDANGKDIFWAAYDNQGNEIDHGGNEAVGPNGGGLFPNGSPTHPTAYGNNVNVFDTITLPAGSTCFSLKVVDGAGNGLPLPGYVRLYDLTTSQQFHATPLSWNAYTAASFEKIGTVGTNEISGVSVSELFPNPTGDVLNVELTMASSIEIRPIITDAAGRIVYTETSVNLPAGVQMMNIPVTTLSNGIYFLQLQTERGMVTQRFVVAK
jgi:hypothetical protein